MRVLVEEVVLRGPHVLEAGAVGGLHELELVHERVVLGLGIHVLTELRRVPLYEDPELHHVPPEVRQLESDTLSESAAGVHPGRPRARGQRGCSCFEFNEGGPHGFVEK